MDIEGLTLQGTLRRIGRESAQRPALVVALFALALAWPLPAAEAGTPALAADAVPLDTTFDEPVYVAAAPGKPRFLFVVEKEGKVRVMQDGVTLERPFLDITELVNPVGEQGLLSIAFPPDYASSRRFYVYFNNAERCGSGCDIEVDEYRARRHDPTSARLNSRRRVIVIPHREAGNHNGGTVAFGPDGKLWLATGDGGGGGDQFHHAEDLGSLLGKLLRIEPLRKDKRRLGHRSPPGNPYVGQDGRDEIWSYGLRNPFRFSFDGSTVAIGDVGQGTEEEVDIVSIADARGAGFGWPEFEGNFDYPESPDYTPPTPPLAPIFSYPNPGGPNSPAAVTGGVVMHDPLLPQFEGRYLTVDFYAGSVGTFEPDLVNNEADDLQTLPIDPITGIAGFNSDAAGRVHFVSLFDNTLYRLEPATP